MNFNDPNHFYDASMSHDTRFLAEHSPDLAIDLALIHFILTMRAYRDGDGEYKNWDRLSINWFAKQCHCGERRVRAALDRLVAWGVIEMKYPERKRKLAMYYRYNKPDAAVCKYQEDRANWGKSAEELELLPHNPNFGVLAKKLETKKEEAKEKAPQKAKQPKADSLKIRGHNVNPSTGGIVGDVWKWEGNKLRKTPCYYEYEMDSPTCSACGRKFDPVDGIIYVPQEDGSLKSYAKRNGEDVCGECLAPTIISKGMPMMFNGKRYEAEEAAKYLGLSTAD